MTSVWTSFLQTSEICKQVNLIIQDSKMIDAEANNHVHSILKVLQ